MRYHVEIKTKTKNGVTTEEAALNGTSMDLFRISRILTRTKGERGVGVFATQPVEIEGMSGEIKKFEFTPKMTLPEKVSMVRTYFQKNDKLVVEEYVLDLPEED